jgi:16S rRNA G966 N2-methylase RsmD
MDVAVGHGEWEEGRYQRADQGGRYTRALQTTTMLRRRAYACYCPLPLISALFFPCKHILAHPRLGSGIVGAETLDSTAACGSSPESFGAVGCSRPDTDATRPVTDRVKQSLFDIVAPLLPDARVYDCFAGTGSMGLESLSRGAAHATFFESDRSAAARLRRNIDAVGVGRQSAVVTTNIFGWFDGSPAPPPDRRADVVFLDPPYKFLRDRPDDLRRLAANLAPDTWRRTG